MKFVLVVTALLAVTCVGNARPVAHWTYEKLVQDADLVVIATPTEARDQEKTVLPHMMRVGPDGKSVPVPAVGIETRFKVLTILKGDKVKDFAVYHLREAKPENVPNGPQFISFDLKGQRRYLLFLKREADGRFVSVTGQLDAAVGVRDLGSYP